MSELVTIMSFSSSMDFEMVKSYLESFEIECFSRDEITNRTYFPNVVGGVKLEVRQEQADEAVRILLEAGYLKTEDFEPSKMLKWIDKILSFFRPKG